MFSLLLNIKTNVFLHDCSTVFYRYYKIIEADHILFIVNRERAGVQFDLLYDGIFQRCRKHAFRRSPPTVPNESSQSQ